MAGETQMMVTNIPGIEPLMKAGRVRALAVTTTKPSPLLPGVPAMAEAGVPGLRSALRRRHGRPARTPAAIINRLNQEIVRALQEPNTKQTLFNSGVVARRSARRKSLEPS